MMLRAGFAVFRKDLLIEWRSRALITRVVPFAVLVLVLFAIALDSEPLVLRAGSGLVWMTTLFSALVVVQRTFELERRDGALDVLKTLGIDGAALFFGKAVAVIVQLIALVVILIGGAIVLYGVDVETSALVLLVTTAVLGSCGVGLVGTLYGGLVSGASGRDTLLPLLLMPVTAPVLIGASRATEFAFGGDAIDASTAWAWVGLLAVFTAVFAAAGAVSFGPLIDNDA
ncbi:MAG: heme exporter protein CcmB [Ilumatobacteraceae bacterium]